MSDSSVTGRRVPVQSSNQTVSPDRSTALNTAQVLVRLQRHVRTATARSPPARPLTFHVRGLGHGDNVLAPAATHIRIDTYAPHPPDTHALHPPDAYARHPA